MILTAGQRLEGRRQSTYVVGQSIAQTPWYELYRARKVFFNHRFSDRQFYEAAEDEWLDVLVRVGASEQAALEPRAAQDNPTAKPAEAQMGSGPVERERRERHDRLLYEATRVLGTGAWFPEPIDWLELSLGSRPGARPLPAARVPILVISEFRGMTLRDWRQAHGGRSHEVVRIAGEILDMLKSLHDRGQVVGAFSPDDFLIDETGRLSFQATDRVIPAAQSLRLRQFFPPSRYPHGFAAPEAIQANQSLDPRSDLYSWATLCYFLATGSDPDAADNEPSAAAIVREFDAWLGDAGPGAIEALHRSDDQYAHSSPASSREWSRALASCLAGSRECRPVSVNHLRGGVAQA